MVTSDARVSCSKVPTRAQALQIECVEECLNAAERVEVTYGIDATSQCNAVIFSRHPLGDGKVTSSRMDSEEQPTAATNPSNDFELSPEKRVKRVLHRYNTLVTGIIMFVLANAATVDCRKFGHDLTQAVS